MADRSGYLTEEHRSGAGRARAYDTIGETLKRAIETETLPPGIVLLEGPIASLFGSSRSTVKRALASLESGGLVRRFDGRGVLAGTSGGPIRTKLTAEMLAIGDEAAVAAKTFAWQSYYYDFEQTIILQAVSHSPRVNEMALARHYSVGRTVAGDILRNAEAIGIVIKDDKSRWWINPMDETRFRDLYELRILLEPVALQSAIENVPGEELAAMEAHVERVIGKYPNIDRSELDRLEDDLHVRLLRFSTKRDIVEALKRTRCLLVAGKHLQQAVRGEHSIDPFMAEHAEILSFVRRRQFNAASASLVRHLIVSSEKAAERLRLFRQNNKAPAIPYLSD